MKAKVYKDGNLLHSGEVVNETNYFVKVYNDKIDVAPHTAEWYAKQSSRIHVVFSESNIQESINVPVIKEVRLPEPPKEIINQFKDFFVPLDSEMVQPHF